MTAIGNRSGDVNFFFHARRLSVTAFGTTRTVDGIHTTDTAAFNETQTEREQATTGMVRVRSVDFPDGVPTETENSVRAHTRGAMLGVTREMIVNDDLGAINDMFTKFGRKVVTTKQRLWFTELLGNIAQFNTTNKNLVPGGHALDIQGLIAATTLLDSQQDESGDPILTSARFLLVPSALWAVAKMVEDSTTLDGAATLQGTSNPLYKSFSSVKSPFIGSSSPLKGGNDKHWFMFCAPSCIPVMGTAHLKGNRRPIMEQSELNFNTLGISYRVYFDYGVKFLDAKGAVYSTGSAKA